MSASTVMDTNAWFQTEVQFVLENNVEKSLHRVVKSFPRQKIP